MSDNDNVKIVYSQVPHADLNTKIATSLAAGEAPTVMGVYGPWMPQLLDAEALAPAPDWVKEDLQENFPEVMKDAATFDGEVYGYVQHIGIFMPIVNEALYEAAGATLPTTYDDLVVANQMIDAPDGSIFGTTLSSTKDGSWNVINWSSILFAHGAEILNEEATQATFNTDVGLEATQLYQQLTHPEVTDEDAFVTEQSAMFLNGPWQKSNFEESAPNLPYKAILPLEGPAGRVASSYVWFWVVSAKATPQEQEEAWRFIQWLSAPEQYASIYRNVGLIPITNELPSELEDDVWVQTFNEGLEYSKIYYANTPKWEQIDVAIGEELERLVVDEITAEEFLQIAEEKVNDILADE